MFLAVIGDPIAHSLSPAIHTAVFSELGLPLTYRKFQVKKDGLAAWLPTVKAEGIGGFNVTMPLKAEAAAVCGSKMASVNTVRVEPDGMLTGFSTDGDGFLLALDELEVDLAGMSVVIAGQGSVASVLSGAMTGRDATVRSVSVREGTAELHKWMPQTGLLINATPLGMKGQDWDDLNFLQHLPKTAVVVDLLYSPPVTSFLQEASTLGLRTQNGLPMLIYQAILSDEIYLRRSLDVKGLKARVEAAIPQQPF